MDRKAIPDQQAKRVKTAAKRVAEHRATEAGTLRTVFDALGGLVKLLADVHAEADRATANEIRIFLEVVRRFRAKLTTNQQARTAALMQAVQRLDQMERLLVSARGPGYALKRLEQESARDLGATKKLRANLGDRSREAAFVLAELEQAVDPVPGLKIASAKVRKENAKRRKAEAKAPVVELKPEALTSKPIERSETL